MTDTEGHDALVTLVDDEESFLQKYPFLTITSAGIAGYVIGRLAGDEILNASVRAFSNLLVRQMETLIRARHSS